MTGMTLAIQALYVLDSKKTYCRSHSCTEEHQGDLESSKLRAECYCTAEKGSFA